MSEIKLVEYDTIFLHKSWRWLTDPEIKKLTDTDSFTKKEQQKWFEGLASIKDYKIWGATLNKLPIGVFGIKNINNHSGEYWGYIGDKDQWGKGFGRVIMSLIIEKAEELQLKELTLKVKRDNIRAIKLYQSVDFATVVEENFFIHMKKRL